MNHSDSRDAVEEANAAIGAALSTSSLPHDLSALLDEVQHDLLDLAEALNGNHATPSPDRLRRALREHAVSALPHGFAVLAGFSSAAALLKLARTVVRRAARAVAATDAREYLDLLAEVLLAVAFRAEEHERSQVPLGCGVDSGPMWSDQHRGHIDSFSDL